MNNMNKEKLNTLLEKVKTDKKERNRYMMLLIAFLLFFDYIIFCFHTGKNPFDIIPSLPLKNEKSDITIYLPDLDGKTIIKEEKKIPEIKKTEEYIQYIFNKVIEGSKYENTSVVVPVDTYIRKIWIYDKTCIIDAGFSLLKKDSNVIKGSEGSFKKALSKSIIENISSIEKVLLLDKGLPNRNIWEKKWKT